MTRGHGDTGTRRSGKRVQGFDVGRTNRESVILALMDQAGNHRLREIPNPDLKADSVSEFLREAWAEGFGGGQPGTLMMDGVVREYDRELLVFLKETGVRVRLLPGPGRGMRGKLERAIRLVREGAQP